MKRVLLMMVAIFSLLACSSEGDPFFGQGYVKKEAVTEAKQVKVVKQQYDSTLRELYLTWESGLDSNFLGARFTYTTISGKIKTIDILRNSNYPQAYNRATLATRTPAKVFYQPIWKDAEGKQMVGDQIKLSSQESKLEFIDAGELFFGDMILPEMTLDDQNPDFIGSKIIKKMAGGDVKEFVKTLIRRVCSADYFGPGDNYPKPPKFNIELRRGTGVAYVAGGKLMYINTNYMAGLEGKPIEESSQEVTGVMLHELTHAMQQVNNHGVTPYDIPGYIEGMADASRLTAGGFSDGSRIGTGKSSKNIAINNPKPTMDPFNPPHPWQTKYRTSGFFFSWLRCYDGDFLRKFHLSLKKLDEWSVEDAIKLILGKDMKVEDLWKEYLEDVATENI